ncbi:hypothetical protein PIB30_102394 [Stylosanthes scabra]|uniref:Zinc finger GRF-type domain-containing protein n=1 Tax=Stylosanthes scabra TaxID=79078 RepID=A0ABU6RY66_9FABA|nr:hypothetical protein [Stylosanthes scabra]
MEIDGVSSGSHRSGSGRRGERSSSSTQGFFAAKVGNERDGAAPKCNCGVYVVLYLSKTTNNSNRLFFGCPFFKLFSPRIGRIGPSRGLALARKLEIPTLALI